MTKPKQLGRRELLRIGVGGMTVIGAVGVMSLPAHAAPTKQAVKPPAPNINGRINPNLREVALINLHSGESFKGVYCADGQHHPEALAQIAAVMRDHQSGSTREIHPDLIDLLAKLQSRLNVSTPIQIISGYRTVETNEMLALASRGVARNSYHIDGMAADIRVPGRGLRQVRDAAWNMRTGGVGYYARSNFVHVDVGPVRRW